MKEAALFFVDYLVKDPKTGYLISVPSNSPEQGGLVMGPTMDHQIIRDLFANTAEAAASLGQDQELAAQLRSLRKQIAPNQNASRIHGRCERAPAFGLRQSSGALGRTLLTYPLVLAAAYATED